MPTQNDLRNLRQAANRARKLERELEDARAQNLLLRRCGIRVGETIVSAAELLERARQARDARATAAQAERAREKSREALRGERVAAPPRELVTIRGRDNRPERSSANGQ
jgi:hypothetical protein